MSSIPSNLSRVPNMLASQMMLGGLTRTNQGLLQTQIQLASGLKFQRPSDNAVAASTVAALDDLLERREQVMRNLSHGESVLNNLDQALGEAGDLVLEAKSIGLSQIGVGSDAATREAEAVVIDAILEQMISVANRKHQDVHYFGGSATAQPPIQGLHGAFEYIGVGDGFYTDLGLARTMPITVSGQRAFGAMSARVEGARDLEPGMTGQTRLADLRGARGQGINVGAISVNVGGTVLSVDLSSAHRVQDVIDQLQQDIQQIDPGATVGLDPTGRRFTITPSAGVDISISDLVGDAAAADLGINMTFSGGATTAGGDVEPLLTEQTPLSNLAGVTVPLGVIRISNGGQVHDLDLSGAETVQDIMTAVTSLNIGVRLEISQGQDRLNFVNQLSGSTMSIGEVGGGQTATELGIRSLSGATLLSEFNHGQGVEIRTGSVDPQTGTPDPDSDLDFRVTLKDGQSFDVDLAGAETVNDVLAAINQAAADEGLTVPTDFEAALAADGNGITLTDNTDVPGAAATTVTALNGSFAAEHLGILGSETGATLTGADRATVAVESVISHLISLRDALRANDGPGISIATSKLEQDFDRLLQTRAEVGGRTRRIVDAQMREEQLQLQDMSLKSQLQDLDYTEAAIEFSMLQQQLQAGLQSASYVSSLSLLDFLR